MSGWRCPALKIPGAKIDAVFVSGNRADSSWYEVNYDLNVIRWVRPKHPLQATILIVLTEELSTKELTLRWKKLAITLPLVSSIIVAMIAGTFSYILSLRTQQTNIPDATTLTPTCAEKVKIIVPVDNATLPIEVNVKGTYQNLEQGQKIYVMIYPTNIGRYYPQPNAVLVQSNNNWSCEVLIGLNHDVGRIFLIHAVLADKEAQNVLDMYVNHIKDGNDSPGMLELPKGAQICSSVRINRK